MIGGFGRWSWWANTVMAAEVAVLWLWDTKWGFLLGSAVGVLLTLWLAR
jgi:hypothetical protein